MKHALFKVPQLFRERSLRLSERILLSSSSSFYTKLLKTVAMFFYGQSLRSLQKKSVGALWLPPSSDVVHAATFGITHNLNHLGNVYSMAEQDLGVSQKIEKKVIEWVKKRLHASSKQLEGYITSGGTESNLFLLWIGREYVQKKDVTKTILISTHFTHYSVDKSARILSIEHQKAAVDPETGAMDPAHLEHSLRSLLKKNPRLGVLMCLTLGYSSTGACDSLSDITAVLKRIHKAFPQSQFYLWIDASMQGLPLMFLDNELKKYPYFTNEFVFGYCVDFHKYGQTPLPTGVVLYRPELRKYIETSIDYLFETDATLLGSRPGFAALSIWATITQRSLQEWKAHFKRMLKRKEKWLLACNTQLPSVKILSGKNTLTVGLVCPKDSTIPDHIVNRYSLYRGSTTYLTPQNKCKSVSHYKLHFSQEAVWDLLDELRKVFAQ